MKRLILIIILTILLTGCSSKTTCPHFPKPSNKVKETLEDYQDKEKNPDTWAWFNDLYKLCQKLGDCD